MNGRKAKQIRRAAERDSVGQPTRYYLIHKTKKIIINSPRSTRGIYQAYKKVAA